MKQSITTILLFASVVISGCATQAMSQRDSGKPETTPTNRFEINRAEGTAFDTKTKLTWKVCAEGQNYSEGHCKGNATRFTWDAAMQTFGDKGDDWRLPNADELSSIVEERYINPAINMTIFPNAPSSDFWSGSSYVPLPALAWCVFFGNGATGTDGKSSDYSVRLVRGGQWLDTSKEDRRKQAELAAQMKQAAELEEAQKQREAEQDAFVTCDDKAACDKAFSLTQIYVNSTASQKIQVATDTIVETYNPTENGNIGMRAVKIPGRGSSAIIRLTVSCKVDDRGIYDKLCGSKRLGIYTGFRPFVNKMLTD